jgi:ATP-binding cassette, subfamily B, bacterial
MPDKHRSPLLRFARVWLRKPVGVAGAYLAALLAAAMAVAAPWPIKIIIDNVLLKQPVGIPAFDGLPTEAQVITMATVAAALAAGAAMASAIERIANARIRERMTQDLRKLTLDHMLGLPVLGRHADRNGELVLRLVDDTGQIARLYCKTLPVLFRHAATFILTLVGMFLLSAMMGILGLVIGLLLALVVRQSAKALRSTSRAKRKREGKVAAFAQEVLRGLPSVQSVGAEPAVRERFLAINADATRTGVEETRVQVLLERQMQIASGVALAFVVGLGGWLVAQNQLTVGSLTVCVAYLNQLLKPVEKINELAGAITGALTRADRLAELLDRPNGLEEPKGAKAPTPLTPVLELRGCSFSHHSDGQDIPSLRAATTQINPGECISISGPSGAGKSTLLGLLLRLYDPDAGELILSGQSYREWPIVELRKQFAVMRQETHLFAGTIRNALQFGIDARSDDDLRNALRNVALDDLVARAGGSLDAPLGEDGGNLSGGQRARLALARSLLADRPFLLLDEPFANIDAESQAVILATLERERGRRTIIIVSHQTLPAGFADRTLHLSNGRLVEALQAGRERAP